MIRVWTEVLLALASLDLNALVLEPVNFDDGDPLERPFSTPDFGLDIQEDEEDGGQSTGNGGDFADSDMQEDY